MNTIVLPFKSQTGIRMSLFDHIRLLINEWRVERSYDHYYESLPSKYSIYELEYGFITHGDIGMIKYLSRESYKDPVKY
jgi:hypothetical protein